MTIAEHETEFAGLPIADFDADEGLSDPQGTAYRIRGHYDEIEITDHLAQLLDDPRCGELHALVIGCWSYESGSSREIVDALVAAAENLPQLRALFLGDITCEESEISWIHQTDLSPLLAAFPELEILRVRGNEELSFGSIDLPRLHTLIVESGGLSVSVIREILAANLPELTHLELWLGSENYGWNGAVADLQPLLSGQLFPRLEYLGLRDCEVADELAAAVAAAPIVRRLNTLDLSLGNMTDTGFSALLMLPRDGRLERLILRHHFANESMEREITDQFDFQVDASDRREPHRHGDDVWRFIAVSE